MTLNVGNLIATLSVDLKEFDKGIKDAGKRTEGFAAGFGERLDKLKVPIAAIAGAVAAMGTAAVFAADDMNKAYGTIRSGSGATGEALEVLKGDFDAVFGTVPAAAGDVATAIADLNTRLELTGEPLQDMATRFLELSRITGTDVGKNIAGVTRALANWGVAGEDQADTLDYLFRTSQSTGIGVDRLSDLSTKYGSTLRGLGYDLETSTALLGKFEKEGVNTEAALAGMKQAVARLAGMGIDDPIEAWDMLADQIKGASTELEAVSIASELFGDRAAAEMASAIRDGNLDLADFVDTLNASEETILDAADDTMTLGDRMAILKNKSQKALEPVGQLMIGAFEKAAPHLEAAADKLAEVGRNVADWAEEAGRAAGPVVDAFKERMAPVIDLLQEKQQLLVDWWAENSEIFIAAWENVAAAITWVVETVIVPLFEWAWPYIESIYSGVLDTMLGVAKLFASILAGDWEAAGDALVDITKGAMSALNGVWAAGWDAIAAGIEFVGQGIADFVWQMWANIVKTTENAINAMIDQINGFLKAINSVTSKVGISVPLLSHITLRADRIEAPKIAITRWSGTTYGQAIDEFLASDEEDIDAEFEDDEEVVVQEQTLLDQVKTSAPPIAETTSVAPVVAVTTPEPEISDVDIEAPEILEPVVSTVTVPAVETPLPVSVENWSDMLVPAEPPEEDTPAPLAPGPVTSNVDIEAPEVTVSTMTPAVDLSRVAALPVTVTNWPVGMQPAPVPEVGEIQDQEPARVDGEDIDAEFETSPGDLFGALIKRMVDMAPETPIGSTQLPDISGYVAGRTPAADPGRHTAGSVVKIVGGETRVVVELDGNVIGETLFRTWNRRTGGALNG